MNFKNDTGMVDSSYFCVSCKLVSVPDPPLKRKDSLVNQVKFLGIAHVLVTVQSSIDIILCKTH